MIVNTSGTVRIINIDNNLNFHTFWLGSTMLVMNAVCFENIIDTRVEEQIDMIIRGRLIMSILFGVHGQTQTSDHVLFSFPPAGAKTPSSVSILGIIVVVTTPAF